MRKRNKILMMAISSLLCLTLISSCLVSSVFAKFVIKDTANIPITFKKFGVTLSVSSLSAADKAKYGVTVTDNSTENLKNAGVYSITVSGLKMGPGDTIDDLISFTIGGTANVDCQLKFDSTISYKVGKNEQNSFWVPSELILSGDSNNYYFPVQVLCDAYDGSTKRSEDINCLSAWRNVSSNSAARTVEQILAQKFDLICDNAYLNNTQTNYLQPQSSSGTTCVYKDFVAGEDIKLYLKGTDDDKNKYNNPVDSSKPVNKLAFALKYHYDVSEETNKIATYFAQQENPPTFSVTFVFTITQTA